MDTRTMIEQIMQNARWKTIAAKAEGKDTTEYNLEEINLLNAYVRLKIQEESRAQAQTMFKLTEASLTQAQKVARWTKLLAIATFLLAFGSTLSIVCRN